MKRRRHKKFSQEDKEAIKTILLSETLNKTEALEAFGIQSIGHAYGILKIRRLDDLKYTDNINIILKPYGLKYTAGRLIGNREYILSLDEAGALESEPERWLLENEQLIREVLS